MDNLRTTGRIPLLFRCRTTQIPLPAASANRTHLIDLPSFPHGSGTFLRLERVFSLLQRK
jgi:hypothetical protein